MQQPQFLAPAFETIKQGLDSFDQNILTRWTELTETSQCNNLFDYLLDVDEFPVELCPDVLIARQNELSLEDVAKMADTAADTDLVIPIEDMYHKFGFSASPVERPKCFVKKPKKSKRSKDKKEKKSKRNPGDPPRSGSTTFSAKRL